jgi:hypothetical protein
MTTTAKPALAGHGRKAGSAALMAIVAGGLVQTLLTNPEATPAATVDPTTPSTSVEAAAEPVTASTGSGTATTRTAPAAGPVEVAAGWYATRHKFPTDQVTGLQADKISPNRIRVLLLVDHGQGRLDSAMVTVTRGKAGWKAGR